MRFRPLALALTAAFAAPLAQAGDLMQTYQLARGHDPQIAAAEAGQRVTAEGEVQTRAAMLPQIGASTGINRSRSTNESGQAIYDPTTGLLISGGQRGSTSTTRNAGFNIDQMLFNGQTIGRHRAQKLQTRAGDHDLEAAGDQLITRTSRAYFDALIAMETLAAAEAQEAALKKQFDFASKRLEVGLAPITDQHEARAQYEGARANTILQRNALEDAYQALAEITGQPVRSLMALPDDFKPQLPAEGSAEDWVNLAVDNNPALAAQKTRVAVAEQNISTARAGHLPSIGARGTWGYQRFNGVNEQIRRTFSNNGWGRNASISLNVNIPIFSGGATQSQVRQAIAQRDVAEQQLEQQKRALERNTRNAYQSLSAGISAVEARRLALVAAQSAYDASQVGLEVGTRTVIDVLLNQQNLFNAQQNYAKAKYDYLQAHLLLRQAAGTLETNDLQDINRLLTAPAGKAPRVTL
ncbi:hypothetical protein EBB59_06110 [Lysobacter pythonis]|uniref:Protein CyaE n=1 Tax=Solilutibacter pythonis TaxID=2483112 RepID=A0A3M2I1P5_9GAMM|nr:TolC family outer membrane protein [Lysobacter pythonis]RMH93112.1 hypothetical protein EBB59_06110 [Lysobacter pythonis]